MAQINSDWTVTGESQLTNIPTLYITTTSGSDPADRETYLNCNVTLVDGDNTVTYELTEDGIRGRGNSTWDANKKPWRIKFDKKKEFLGSDYAKAKSWTLLANTFDKSLMRNALTYHLGTFMGMEFCPAYKFVDLVMNGTYRGTYQISDQVEARAKRVPVDEDNGWLLEYGNASDKVDEPKIALNNNNTYYGEVEVKNPEFENDELSSNPTLDNWITSYLNDSIMPTLTESTLTNRVNLRTGYRSLIDDDALINWYIATEITANWDGFYSIYMFRDVTGDDTKLHFGPLWDEDLAYGNHTETYEYVTNFYDKLLVNCNFDQNKYPNAYRKMTPVINQLWNDPWFAVAVNNRYNELIVDGLEDHLLNAIEEMRTELTESAAKNFSRWNINTDDTGYAVINGKYTSYASTSRTEVMNAPQTGNTTYTWDNYVDELKAFISGRLAKLSSLFKAKLSGITYITEDADNAISTTSSTHVVIKRDFYNGEWNTMCLPFALTESDVSYYFGSDAKVLEFTNVTEDDTTTPVTIELNFKPVTSTVAGTPYLVKPTDAISLPFVFLNRSLMADPSEVEHDSYTLVGIYNPYELTAYDYTKLFLGANNNLYTPATTGYMKGLRAYFKIPAEAVKKTISIEDGGVTGISRIATGVKSSSNVYNLNGQRVSGGSLPKGIYIVNGKKIIKK